MKKSFLALASFAAIAVACQVEKMDNELPLVDNSVVYTASTEAYAPATKTAMDGLDVVWSAGDQISVFEGWDVASTYSVTSGTEGKTTAEFTVVSSANIDETFDNELGINAAIYPYSEYAYVFAHEEMDETTFEYYSTGNYVFRGIEIPKNQEYVPGSFAKGAFPMVAFTESVGDRSFKFKNLLGAVRLNLVGTDITIKSITLTDLAGGNLAGQIMNVIYGPECDPTLAFNYMDSPISSVILNCGEGVQLSPDDPTEFVFAVAPVVFESGFSVSIKDVDGNIYNKSTSAENEVKRSSVLDMPTVNVDEFDMIPFVDVDVTVESVPAMTDVELEISLEADAELPGFYGIFLQPGMWEAIQYYIEAGMATFTDILGGILGFELPVCNYAETTYSGNLTEFGWSEDYLLSGAYNMIEPNTDYQIAIVPIIDGKTEYSLEDAQLFDVPTLGITNGGDITEPTYSIDQHYLYCDVTVNVSDDVVYAKYEVIKPGGTCPTEDDYLETVTYDAYYSQGDGSFEVVVGNNTSIMPGATCTLCVMLVNEDGMASFFTKDVTLLSLPQDENATVEFMEAEYDDEEDEDLNNDVVYVEVQYPTNAASIYYLASTAGNFNDYSTATAQAQILEGTTAWKHVDITDDSGETVFLETSPVGNAYGAHTEVICVIVVTEDGKVGPLSKSGTINVPKRR